MKKASVLMTNGLSVHTGLQAVSCNTRSKSASSLAALTNPQPGKRSFTSSKSSCNQSKDDYSIGVVRHDVKGNRFILDLGNDKTARIDYKPIEGTKGQNTVELYHSEVPEDLRGQGIGRALARGGFECASEANMKLKVTCTYLQAYLNKFADEKHRKLVIE